MFELTSLSLVRFQIRSFKCGLEPFIRHIHSKTTTQRLLELVYKTCFYANLADVNRKFLCWSNILTVLIKVSNSFVAKDRKSQGIHKQANGRYWKNSCHMIWSLTDRQTSWYRVVRPIRSNFWIEACESVILFWNDYRRCMVEKSALSTSIYRVV